MSTRADLFNATVAQLRNGTTQAEASEMLAELVQACRDTNKIGELTLKIKVRPDGASGQYFLEDQVTINAPKPERGKTLFFGSPEGNLSRTDPNQKELNLRDVSDEQNTRELDDDRPAIKAI
tara:strand:+ start:31643 stop:32008 length:366 start_codon:yes stop_codon:yes gene_type:complete